MSQSEKLAKGSVESRLSSGEGLRTACPDKNAIIKGTPEA